MLDNQDTMIQLPLARVQFGRLGDRLLYLEFRLAIGQSCALS
jgi:hypothetical protein